MHRIVIYSREGSLMSRQQKSTFSYKHGFPAASGIKGLAVICSELTIRPESTDGKKLASNSFQHSSHISMCAPWWWEGRAGQWMVSIQQSNYNNIPHADGCVLPALPFYLWLSLQQVQVFSYLATVVMGHGFSRGDDRESAVSSRVVAASTCSPFETRTHGPGFYSTQREQVCFWSNSYLMFMSSKQMSSASEVKCFVYFLNKFSIFKKFHPKDQGFCKTEVITV